ncbi:MAG: hypothetical protein HQL54_03045, partial [Magnetococcales bacterium]|nr:hypothetical protein [Magnetococcales bacterium]
MGKKSRKNRKRAQDKAASQRRKSEKKLRKLKKKETRNISDSLELGEISLKQSLGDLQMDDLQSETAKGEGNKAGNGDEPSMEEILLSLDSVLNAGQEPTDASPKTVTLISDEAADGVDEDSALGNLPSDPDLTAPGPEETPVAPGSDIIEALSTDDLLDPNAEESSSIEEDQYSVDLEDQAGLTAVVEKSLLEDPIQTPITSEGSADPGANFDEKDLLKHIAPQEEASDPLADAVVAESIPSSLDLGLDAEQSSQSIPKVAVNEGSSAELGNVGVEDALEGLLDAETESEDAPLDLADAEPLEDEAEPSEADTTVLDLTEAEIVEDDEETEQSTDDPLDLADAEPLEAEEIPGTPETLAPEPLDLTEAEVVEPEESEETLDLADVEALEIPEEPVAEVAEEALDLADIDALVDEDEEEIPEEPVAEVAEEALD